MSSGLRNTRINCMGKVFSKDSNLLELCCVD